MPTVDEVLRDEDRYNSLVRIVLATPIDFMVQLDDSGIDFETISSYELFLMFFMGLRKEDPSLIFGSLDLNKFELDVNRENGMVILKDRENGIIIDRGIHDMICRALREINRLEKDFRKPANEEAKKYMLQRARMKMRRARKQRDSELEDLIVALVNTEQFKYDFDGAKNLTIYQFNRCVHQIIKKINFDNTMIGCYAGTVDIKKIDQNNLNWLTSKTGGNNNENW